MRKILKGQKGLSLVEVTIMLLVLMLLTSVLAPSIWDFVHDAQWVKVKEDCEAIGITFTRLVRDVGPCLHTTGATVGCAKADRVDVLISDGVDPTTTTPAVDFSSTAIVTKNWYSVGNIPATNNFDQMYDQFVTNAPAYKTPMELYPTTYPVGPLFGLGWRGSYIAPPIGPDPWGGRYQVNSGFFAVATDVSGVAEGDTGRWWERDVVCLSPGPDGIIMTPFASPVTGLGNINYGTYRNGDDFVFVISGSGR